MAYNDLREFITALEQRGQLQRISQPVSAELEITEITDRVAKLPGERNVALLFEHVQGYSLPVLTNAFGSYDRTALALGVSDINILANEIRRLIQLPLAQAHSKLEIIKLLPQIKRLAHFPRFTRHAPCQEVVVTDQPSLNILPILKCWPGDAGRFITLPVVFTKNPLTGKVNAGMYRMQVFDGQTTGMHWHLHKNGAENYAAYRASGQPRMEVAVAIGTDPAVTYAATAPLPRDLDEIVFAGFLRDAPVEMVRAKTIDLAVPAHAEIVLEGYVDTKELHREGPFGDHTGYYSQADDYPVFHLTCITHRRQPIYAATVVGKPPMEDCYLAKATERLFLPLLQLLLPEISDLNLPLAGVFHNCAIAAINKTYPQQAKKVMHALWGLGQMMFTKMIIIVDAQVNVQDLDEVWWRVFNNIDARRDIVLVDGPVDVLDHASPQAMWGTKVGIDATRTWPEEGHQRPWPEEVRMSADVKQRIDAVWPLLGLG